MARHSGRHSARRGAWPGSVAVLAVVALTGYLLMTNLRVNRSVPVTSDTAGLVEQRVAEVQTLQDDVNRLSSQVDSLNKAAGAGGNDDGGAADDTGSDMTLPAVEGPGVAVTLDDSPMWEQAVDSSGSSADIDKYVVHQQDIEAVVNALWRGGAEAMMFEDQRMLFNSAVLCSGNVVSLHGKKYSPPFTITAIGPQDRLVQALDDSRQIGIYREYVSAFGLGWKVERRHSLSFPETAALLQPLRYASALPASDGRAPGGDDDADGADGADGGPSDGSSGATGTDGDDGSSGAAEGER